LRAEAPGLFSERDVLDGLPGMTLDFVTLAQRGGCTTR
jgi:hypothetical protein